MMEFLVGLAAAIFVITLYFGYVKMMTLAGWCYKEDFYFLLFLPLLLLLLGISLWMLGSLILPAIGREIILFFTAQE